MIPLRDKETKRRRVKETKRLKVKESKRLKVKESKSRREEETDSTLKQSYSPAIEQPLNKPGSTHQTTSAPCILTILTHRLQNFPHPRRFFGFNTSCFWRRNVLYLYRDMGGASAPPFFRHFPFKNGDFGAHPGKICLPLIFICLPQILIRGRQRKTMCRVGKIGRRKVFSKVKNVNVESLKKRSKLLDFSARSFLFPLHQCS